MKTGKILRKLKKLRIQEMENLSEGSPPPVLGQDFLFGQPRRQRPDRLVHRAAAVEGAGGKEIETR